MSDGIEIFAKHLPVFNEAVSFDAVVRRETRCFPTPREVSTGSMVAFCLSRAETVFGPMVSRGEEKIRSSKTTPMSLTDRHFGTVHR